MIKISFSKPFVHVPPRDDFPYNVVNENLGYVPQTLIDWMARDSDCVSKFPGIASCLPGGPALEFDILNPLVGKLDWLSPQLDLTVSSTVTVAGKGCFHPGACPTPAVPGATAVAATPEVTTEAARLRKPGPSRTVKAHESTFTLRHL